MTEDLLKVENFIAYRNDVTDIVELVKGENNAINVNVLGTISTTALPPTGTTFVSGTVSIENVLNANITGDINSILNTVGVSGNINIPNIIGTSGTVLIGNVLNANITGDINNILNTVGISGLVTAREEYEIEVPLTYEYLLVTSADSTASGTIYPSGSVNQIIEEKKYRTYGGNYAIYSQYQYALTGDVSLPSKIVQTTGII